MRINTNMAALNAWRTMTNNGSNLQKSLERLASGSRLNRAADDAAGLAVSEKMNAQIRGNAMATRNTQDAISLVQTAEGGAAKVQEMMQRMRELAVQAGSDTLQSDDRQKLQEEFVSLQKEIDRTTDTVTFNTLKLINGDSGQKATLSSGASGINISGLNLNNLKEGLTSRSIRVDSAVSNGSPAVAKSYAFTSIANVGDFGDDQTIDITMNATTTSIRLGDLAANGTAYNKQASLSDTAAQLTAAFKNAGKDVTFSVNGSGALVATSDVAGTAGDFTLAVSNAAPTAVTNTVAVDGSPATAAEFRFDSVTAGTDFAAGDSLTFTGSAGSVTVTGATVVDGAALNTYATTAATVTALNNAYSAANGVTFFDDGGRLGIRYNTLGSAGNNTANFDATSTISTVTFTTANDAVNATAHKVSLGTVTPGTFSDDHVLSIAIGGGAAVTLNMNALTSDGNTAFNELGSLSALVNELNLWASGSSTAVTFSQSGGELFIESNVQGTGSDLTVAVTGGPATTSTPAADAGVATSFTVGLTDSQTGQALVAGTDFTVSLTGVVNGVAGSIYEGLSFSVSNGATGSIDISRGLTLQIGANSGETITTALGNLSSEELNIDAGSIDITSKANASAALTALDDALSSVSTERAKMGAIQNRLENTIGNLQTQSENLTAANSRIRDLDMASEMAQFTKFQILSQASTAMLAQANQITQGVLTLLR